MAILIRTMITCSSCKNRIVGAEGHKILKTIARENAVKEGWIRVKYNQSWFDFCPNCSKEEHRDKFFYG